MSLPEHLGGHKNITHLDEGALDHMMRILNVKSMLDIGCGPGGMVKLAKSKGLDAYGIDGDFSVERDNHENVYNAQKIAVLIFDKIFSFSFFLTVVKF